MGSTRIQQIYGYLVCLIAIITLLFSVSALIGAIFDLTRPEGTDRWGQIMTVGGPEGSASTYEEYRLNQLERAAAVQEKTGRTDVVLADSTMRRMYDEKKSQAQANKQWYSVKSIVTSTLMILLAVALFLIHWRWLQSVARRTQENGV